MSAISEDETFSPSLLVRNDLLEKEGKTHPLISDEATVILIWILDTGICQAINAFGVGSNIVNIMCFIKQGFKDPVNISLLGLAIADIGSLITLSVANIFLTPAFITADLPFDAPEIMFPTSGLPHVTFSRISGWVTALITLERCLCITAPLKVKNIVTPKRVTCIIVAVFIVLTSSVAPIYVINKLGMKFYPAKNKTLLGLVYAENRETVEKVSYLVNNVSIPFSAFLVIIVCTLVLIFKLQKVTKWRTRSTTSVQGDVVSNRNQKVAVMVVMISILFISCFIPICILYIAMSLLPELSIVGKHKNVLLAVAGLAVLLESINSSSNIFIYYQMSSNFRISFDKLFSRVKQKK